MVNWEVPQVVTAMEAAARGRWLALALAFVSQWGNALAYQAVAPLAPLFQSELRLTKAEVGLFSTAIFAGTWCVLAAGGSLTDRFGTRRLMALGQLMAGGLLAAMAAMGSFVQAALLLAVAGLGRGLVAPSSSKVVAEWFPSAQRATAMGIQQSAAPLAGIAAAVVLPTVGLAIGWRAAISLVGVLVLAGGLLTAALYRNAPRREPSRAARSYARLTFAQMVRDRYLWHISVIGLLFAGAQMCLVSYLPLYLQESVLVSHLADQRARVVAAGGYLALCHMGGVFSRVVWGVLADRVLRGRNIAALGATGALACLMSLALAGLNSDCPMGLIAPVAFTLGAAVLGWSGLYLAVAAQVAGPRQMGTMLGLIMTIMQLGLVVGPPIFGFVVDMSGSFRVAWLGLGGLFAGVTMMTVAAARGEEASAR